MNDYANAIEINGLTKKYDGFTLDKLSFNVPKGSIMGFIGQNGAGKSTTINTILNIVKADEGSIKVMGLDHIKDENEIKRNIAAVFDELPFNEQLNANDIDFIFQDLFENWDSETYFGYLDRFALPRKKKFGQFSKGMKMKLQIASALSHGAKLLIMDEATTGLDPVVRNEILDIFLEYLQDEDNSILMSSHITSDLEKIADSVTFIDKGKLLLTGYKDDILDSHGILKCTKKDFAEIEKSDFISARLTDFGADVMVADRRAAAKKYSGITIDKTTLEDIMLFYVSRGKKEWR
ncbi:MULTISPECIES: ABC transporter ATP-binding protein [Ruminococcus]|uniref:ABC transporter related protein n=1 Tax=Ruminococcus albus (strain ATCC 27210 / DSM 20455 / JCM 14654 / NCDO 2250 / 7) TaxID=697329 RepID=E6UFG8_RUMA7|nr:MULTISPECIES: ABC transporter ATP-binding protein [Ruminococcus]ADU21872.1 ABC transporter related protein [Ruminococcus albus 7 = DSM 20455]MCR5022014.1 ABC transporter ATP-binding protein [Ruminococcus sp.]